MSAASGTSAAFATPIGLPLSRDSSSASSSAYLVIRSPIRQMILARSDGVRDGHAPVSKARRAAITAASTSALSPSAASAITSPVAGFLTSKVLPEAAATHFPLISSFLGAARNCATGFDVRISLRTAFIVLPHRLNTFIHGSDLLLSTNWSRASAGRLLAECLNHQLIAVFHGRHRVKWNLEVWPYRCRMYTTTDAHVLPLMP